MQTEQLMACRRCSKLVSTRVGNGMHGSCWAALERERQARARTGEAGSHGIEIVADDLPNMRDIGLKQLNTREFLEPDILAKAERAFLQIIAEVLQYNDPEAWTLPPEAVDSELKRNCRRAWSELMMFNKTCLPQLPGGKKKATRNTNIILSRLSRWEAGERKTLWDELANGTFVAKKGKPLSPEMELVRRQEIAMAYAEHGAPGKAVNRLISPGLAPDTPAVEAKMRSKFIPPPSGQASTRRPAAPPATKLSDAQVARAIRSFQWSAGAGPSGCRPDFLRQIIGKKEDRPGLRLVTEFCNLLADGQAPQALRSFFGGANGFAFRKEAKDGVSEDDARPVCSGEVWRRVVGKALFRSEESTFQEHLGPHQLAVSVRSGSEVMAHLSREWLKQHCDDPSRLMIDSDKGNAHNEVDRHTFLSRMREVCPGVSRWLEFIYPTDRATMVFYKRSVLDSCAGGQQGCPLMGACHAMVERILLEAAGILPVDSSTTPVATVMEPPASLDMIPMFADDCIIAGTASEVLRTLQHWVPLMPTLGLRFSKLDAIPASGERHTIDMRPFVSIGCTVNTTQSVVVMKSPIGSKEFCEEVVGKRVLKSSEALSAIANLPKEHCALYLLKYQAGRMGYTQRTTPASSCCDALQAFDESMLRAFEKITGRDLLVEQGQQILAPMRHAGFGLRSAVDTADEAYVASLMATCKIRGALYNGSNEELQLAIDRVNLGLPNQDDQLSIPDDDVAPVSQQQLGRTLAAARHMDVLQASQPMDTARLNLFSAPGASRWLDATPSLTLDKYLTNREISICTSLSLGVDVFGESCICTFCGRVSDCKGIHALSCMAGGDVVLRHNAVRDILYWFCSRGRLAPQLEKVGLLEDDAIVVNLRRPADVLANVRTSRSDRSRPERTAIDVKVINGLGQSHFGASLICGRSAAEAYRITQLEHLNTQSLCAARGITYEPVVFTVQGGMERHAEALLSRIAQAVSQEEGGSVSEVKAEIVQTISISLARSAASTVMRRRPRPLAHSSELQRALQETSILETDL